ncbi:MAG: MerR family DNA-binding transcriptional regulator [Hyphomonadaceae bacterium]|mgnify:FL=1|jgi:DNA-binding transcriptional MerR regulator|nr:MerR family DNA-binding transcriptional regulator [Hyphomonadaceae bacterium]
MKTYTISELAREFQVTPRALRFYEDKGLLSPTRDGLNRVYSTRDRARLKLILQGKSVGFSLSDIREILDLYTLEGHRAQLKLSLKKSRDQIRNLEKQREDVEAALETLHKGVKWAEEKLQELGPGAEVEQSARAYERVARAGLDGDAAHLDS